MNIQFSILLAILCLNLFFQSKHCQKENTFDRAKNAKSAWEKDENEIDSLKEKPQEAKASKSYFYFTVKFTCIPK